jgi:hypothetical protein
MYPKPSLYEKHLNVSQRSVHVMSSLRRMQEQFWSPTAADISNSVPLLWRQTVHYRASSLTEAPEKAQMQPLDQDPLRLSFWVAVIYACNRSDDEAKHLLGMLKAAAASMRITFQFCASDEQCEQRKWRLSNSEQFAAAHATLRGWKRIVGIATVGLQLKMWSLDSSPDAVSKWFLNEKIVMSAKVVRQTQGVYNRMVAIDCNDFMEQLEDAVGIDHCLSKVTVLEAMCTMTKLDKNVGLQNSLLRWVCDDISQALMAQCLPVDLNREAAVSHARASLLGRRVVFYLISKLRAPGQDDSEGATRAQPPFTTRETCHLIFYSHKRFEDSKIGLAHADHTWQSALLPYQLEMLTVLKQFMLPNPLIREALYKTTQQNPMISAEETLQQAPWLELVNLPRLLELRQSDLVAAGLVAAGLVQQAQPVDGESAAASAADQSSSVPPSLHEAAAAQIPDAEVDAELDETELHLKIAFMNVWYYRQ